MSAASSTNNSPVQSPTLHHESIVPPEQAEKNELMGREVKQSPSDNTKQFHTHNEDKHASCQSNKEPIGHLLTSYYFTDSSYNKELKRLGEVMNLA